MALDLIRANNGGHVGTRRLFSPLERLHQDFDTLFGRLLGGFSTLDQDSSTMRVWDFNVKETDNEIVVRAEIPGFDENELDVQINNDILTIKAEKEKTGDNVEEYRSFFRSMSLPSGIDADKVQANYRNGVLELRMPRSEGMQPRKIKI